MNKPTCFFCYAWCKNDRYDYLKFIANQIRSKSQNKIEVILDRESYLANEDFDEKEREINQYDLIVVCNSTELFKVYSHPEENSSRRVLKELKIIEKRNANNRESVFSITVEGEDDIILPMFKNRNTKNINDFDFIPNDDIKIPFVVIDHQKREFNDFIDRIIHLAKVNNLNRSTDYKNAREALDNLLTLTDITNLPPSCLIHTDIYDKIINQDKFVYFVVGRKGAGKSTLIHNFKNHDSSQFNNQYKQTLPISAESFQHEMAYNILYAGHKVDSDIITHLLVFELFWGLFFSLHCIISVGCEIEVGGITKDDPRYSAFLAVTKALKDKLSMKDASGEYKEFCKTDDVVAQLFRYCVEVIDKQFNNPAEAVGEVGVFDAFTAHMNVDDILIGLFGKNEIQSFQESFSSCKKRIIVSIDGFDDHSEQFRNATLLLAKDSDEYKNRLDFDKVFFRSMLNSAQKIKEHKYNDPIFSTFGNNIDFCIVLPNDRYNSVIDDDRDATKKKFIALMWDGYELIEMLVKRLEYLAPYMGLGDRVDFAGADPLVRFNTLIGLIPNLPNEVGINIGGEEKRISLFNYLLRYSFWRPRDVISNLNSVMSAVIQVDENDNTKLKQKADYKLSSLDIRILTKNNIEHIYRTEFIQEFKNVYPNLDDVLDRFQGQNVAYTVQEFRAEMSNIYFATAFARKIETFDEKTKTLYQLGTIGIIYPKNSKVEYLSKTCFIFNCGMTPMEDLLQGKKANNVKIVFNPLIAHYQDMVWNIPDIIGNWSDEEFQRMHALHSAVKGL